jgi:uncharacterized membrane protein
MRVVFVVFGVVLTTAIIVFAIANPDTEVEFSALMIAYRGNLLGLAMVLIALAVLSFGLRVSLKQLSYTRAKRNRRAKGAT